MAQVIQPSKFHAEIVAAASVGLKANMTVLAKMEALITSKYGKVAPTYEQFRADHAALGELAKEKGLKDSQWVRKPFNCAVKSLYKALPESQSVAALAKRALREKEGKTKPGAVKKVTGTRAPSHAETIEQFIARVGVFKVLDACTAVLAADDSTKATADTLKALRVAA
jgi:hypothetical protein